jgi:hypothetical protein
VSDGSGRDPTLLNQDFVLPFFPVAFFSDAFSTAFFGGVLGRSISHRAGVTVGGNLQPLGGEGRLQYRRISGA